MPWSQNSDEFFGKDLRVYSSPAAPKEKSALAQQAYVAFVQICKGNSDDAGTYAEDEELVRQALKRLDDLEQAAALAQPEPQGPTDEKLDEFAIYWWGSETDERSVSDVIECGSMAAYARAVLAHWGSPAIEPVPGVEGEP